MTTTTTSGPSSPETRNLPDTLDLAARADLAVNALVHLRDEALSGQLYFYIRLYEEPPTGYHAPWDYGDGTGRHIDALLLAHIMSGSQQALTAAHQLADLLLTWQGDKGLFWWPQESWNIPGPASTGLWRFVDDPKPMGKVAEIAWSARGALLGLTTLYQFTGEERFLKSAKAMVAGLDQIALAKDDYRYFPELVYPQDTGWRTDDESRSNGTSELKNGPIIHALLRFHKATGDTQALELAGGLLRFIIQRAEGYELDGRFYKTNGHWNHFHSKSEVITASILYGLYASKPQYIAWGRQAYDQARRWGTDFGWYPEDLCIHQCCETCCITDMLESAILLGLHVDPRYLGEAERYARNHLVESQIIDDSWMARIPRVPKEINPVTAPARRTNSHDMVKRSIGSFAGFSAPNDLFGIPADPIWQNVRVKIMQCCNGAGTRALYDVWHHTADDDGSRARVHMAFSRPTPWADIISHIPYTGRIDVRMKQPRDLAVRIPEWAPKNSIQALVNNKPVPLTIDNQYASFPALKPGDTASLTYDLPESSRTYILGPDTYQVAFKGDTALAISPQGRYGPLYQRRHYQSDTAPQTPRNWHLPSKEIDAI